VDSNLEISIKVYDKSGKKFISSKTKMSGNHFWEYIYCPINANRKTVYFKG